MDIQAINFVFRDPFDPPCPPDVFSMLYLLRRDMLCCLGVDLASGKQGDPVASWPALMLAMAGTDLLAKYFEGDDSNNRCGQRFKTFLIELFNIIPDESDLLWLFRNSLMHSFGLVAYGNSKSKIYHFQISRGGPKLVESKPNDLYVVSGSMLIEGFERAVCDYHGQLLDPEHPNHGKLNNNFEKMFKRYSGVAFTG